MQHLPLTRRSSNLFQLSDSITLTNKFRSHPIAPRTFDFKKVNLISGVNGVGKTSLLESLELVVCRKTLRNKDHAEKDGAVEAIINGNVSRDMHPIQQAKIPCKGYCMVFQKLHKGK
jgi:recombinational DNA repair ATPase RecF